MCFNMVEMGLGGLSQGMAILGMGLVVYPQFKQTCAIVLVPQSAWERFSIVLYPCCETDLGCFLLVAAVLNETGDWYGTHSLNRLGKSLVSEAVLCGTVTRS